MNASEILIEKFSRAKTCYEQNFLQFRSLNEQMNRVPTIAVTLTGGLWYGAAIAQGVDLHIRFGLLFFASVANLALILSVLRIRDVMAHYLEKLREYDPSSFVTGQPADARVPRLGDYGMIGIYSSLMGAAAILSLIGAFFFYWPFLPISPWIGFAVTLWIAYSIIRPFMRRNDVDAAAR